MTYLTRLECAVPCDSEPFDPLEPRHLCPCGAPLLARYDLGALAREWTPEMLRNRSASLWRYREVLPLDDREEPVSLGEGFTPLIRARHLERTLGMATIYIKDESLNPTNSFKARGMSVAVTKARQLGATILSGAVGRKCGERACRICGTRRTQSKSLHAPRRTVYPLSERLNSTVPRLRSSTV